MIKIFPTNNEKYITIILLAFIVGAFIGLLAGFNGAITKDVSQIIATLFAALFGATTAFLLEDRARKRERRASQLDDANKLLYMLFERLNTIMLFKIDFVDPVRDSPAKMIEMQPVANFNATKSEFTAEKVSFLFQTKYKDLMIEIHVANDY